MPPNAPKSPQARPTADAGTATRKPSSVKGKQPGGPPARLSSLSLIALICSAFGFLLITVPVGLFLGYKGLDQSTGKNATRDGSPFARAAIWLGWVWVAFWALALIAYLWILF